MAVVPRYRGGKGLGQNYKNNRRTTVSRTNSGHSGAARVAVAHVGVNRHRVTPGVVRQPATALWRRDVVGPSVGLNAVNWSKNKK